MPIRRNSAYSDPAIAKSFDNIASMFKPPDGSDVYGYAHAASEKAKAGRLAELYALAKDPNTSREQLDRLGLGAGTWNPNQSFYSVDQGNKTAVDTNAATNKTTIEKAGIDNAGQLARLYATPIHVNENQTVRLPDQTAAATGLPGMFGGQLSVNQGETVRTAAGETIQGQKKPLSDAETKGAILAGLPQSEQRAVAMQGVPMEVVKGPDGQPVNAFRPDAAGATPIIDESKRQKPTVANYKMPDMQGKPGMAGTAVWDDATGWKDSQTGEKLPAGAVTYTAALQGDKAGTGLGPTTANNTSANNRAAEVTRSLHMLDLYEGLVRQNPGVVGLPALIRGTAQDAVGTANDIAKSFGKTVPQVQEAAGELSKNLKGVAPELFDPAIPQADFYKGTLAYALARTENPSGEVSRQAYDRAHERMAGGILSHSDRVLAQTDAFRKTLQAELDGINVLRNPSTARTDTAYKPSDGATAAPGAVEEWTRGPDGKLVRAK